MNERSTLCCSSKPLKKAQMCVCLPSTPSATWMGHSLPRMMDLRENRLPPPTCPLHFTAHYISRASLPTTFHERQFYLAEEFESSPHFALTCAVTRSSWDDLVGVLRFCMMAARWNSSRAPDQP